MKLIFAFEARDPTFLFPWSAAAVCLFACVRPFFFYKSKLNTLLHDLILSTFSLTLTLAPPPLFSYSSCSRVYNLEINFFEGFLCERGVVIPRCNLLIVWTRKMGKLLNFKK